MKVHNCSSTSTPFHPSFPSAHWCVHVPLLNSEEPPLTPFVNNNQNSGRVSRPYKSQGFGWPWSGRVGGGGVGRLLFTPHGIAVIKAALRGCSSPNGSLFFRCGVSQVDKLSDMKQWECEGCAYEGVFFAFFCVVVS